MQEDLLTISMLQEAFAKPAGHPPMQLFDQRCSAVALMFATHQDELSLCVGRRAKFEGDPWSGDMALPGGKADPGDETFHDVALREVWEETGLLLQQAQFLGAVADIQTHGSATRKPLTVRGLVYHFEQAPGPFKLNAELDVAYWIPVRHLWDPLHQTELTWTRTGRAYPGIRYEDEIIWGLTLRILENFAHFIGRPLPIPVR